MGDEQHGRREVLQRSLERLAALEVEVVGRLVEDEEVRARGDDDRQREPPPLAAGEHARPASRATPSRRRGTGRAGSAPPGRRSPVIDWTHSSTEPRSSSSASCCEKYAGTTPWPSRTVPVAGAPRRAASPAASSSRSRSARRGRRARRARPPATRRRAAACRRRDSDSPSTSTTVRPLRGGFRNSKPSRRDRRDSSASSSGGDRLLLLQPPDVRELRLRLLRLRLLVAEPVDEALEPRDVGVVALDRLRRVERTRRLLAPPDVPLAREVRRAPGLELEHRRRHRLEEPAVVRDEDRRRRPARRASARATRAARRRGGSSARRAAAGPDRLPARAPATRASARRRRTSSSCRSSSSSSKPSPRSAESEFSRHA